MDGVGTEALAHASVLKDGRRRGIRWTRGMKEAFLNHLAATCHVAGAAEAIGVDLTTMYALRRRDAAFAAAWREALALGYEMLETRVVGHALAGGGRTIPGVEPGRGAVDIELALKLLTIHRNAMLGKPFKSGRRARLPTPQETNAAILKKLRVVEEGMRRTAGHNGGDIAAEEVTPAEAQAVPSGGDPASA